MFQIMFPSHIKKAGIGSRMFRLFLFILIFIILHYLYNIYFLLDNFYFEFLFSSGFVRKRSSLNYSQRTSLDRLFSKFRFIQNSPFESEFINMNNFKEDLDKLKDIEDKSLIKDSEKLLKVVENAWKNGHRPSKYNFISQLDRFIKKYENYYILGKKIPTREELCYLLGWPGALKQYLELEKAHGAQPRLLANIGADSKLETWINSNNQILNDQGLELGKATISEIKKRKNIDYQTFMTLIRLGKIASPLKMRDGGSLYENSSNWDPNFNSLLYEMGRKEVIKSFLEGDPNSSEFMSGLGLSEELLSFARDKRKSLLVLGVNSEEKDNSIIQTKDLVYFSLKYGEEDSLGIVYSNHNFNYVYFPNNQNLPDGLKLVSLLRKGKEIIHNLNIIPENPEVAVPAHVKLSSEALEISRYFRNISKRVRTYNIFEGYSDVSKEQILKQLLEEKHKLQTKNQKE